MTSHPGDKVGYVVMVLDSMGDWDQATFPPVLNIGQAVGILERYQDSNPGKTYAVAALTLAMVSRSDGKD